MEKIFPIDFNCDTCDENINLNELIDKVSDKEDFDPVFLKLKTQIKELVTTIWFSNPRHLQRYLNKWKIVSKSWLHKLTHEEKDYEIFLYCWYAYLFEFERDLFDKTTDIKVKKLEYLRRVNSYLESNWKNCEFFDYLSSLKDSEMYLLPYPIGTKSIDLLSKYWWDSLNKSTVLKDKNFWSKKEWLVFDKMLNVHNWLIINSPKETWKKGSDKVMMLNQEIDYQSIITTIQTIF